MKYLRLLRLGVIIFTNFKNCSDVLKNSWIVDNLWTKASYLLKMRSSWKSQVAGFISNCLFFFFSHSFFKSSSLNSFHLESLMTSYRTDSKYSGSLLLNSLKALLNWLYIFRLHLTLSRPSSTSVWNELRNQKWHCWNLFFSSFHFYLK